MNVQTPASNTPAHAQAKLVAEYSPSLQSGLDAAHNLAVFKQITLNLICLDPVKRKGASKPDV